ncbi:unnamed protein product [Toxocara canis]|uniref:DRBM domain-containing protein n=1 Tax=Toxocara canis TaxID=6265 RepID=A0A183UV29_TOXCA|nr:unnamed protein product [Toxocara canis]
MDTKRKRETRFKLQFVVANNEHLAREPYFPAFNFCSFVYDDEENKCRISKQSKKEEMIAKAMQLKVAFEKCSEM